MSAAVIIILLRKQLYYHWTAGIRQDPSNETRWHAARHSTPSRSHHDGLSVPCGTCCRAMPHPPGGGWAGAWRRANRTGCASGLPDVSGRSRPHRCIVSPQNRLYWACSWGKCPASKFRRAAHLWPRPPRRSLFRYVSPWSHVCPPDSPPRGDRGRRRNSDQNRRSQARQSPGLA